MQDRFKFRVWNKENKKLYDWDFLEKTKGENTFFWVMHQAQNDCKHNILMQCTGLKDKNGKLIYEGDILNYSCLPGYLDIYTCTFNKGDFLIGGLLISNTHLKSEIIGNIYENPELLEVSDEH